MDFTEDLWEQETSLIGSADFQSISGYDNWKKKNSAALPVKMKWLSNMVKKDLFLNKDVVTITYKKWEVWQFVETLS